MALALGLGAYPLCLSRCYSTPCLYLRVIAYSNLSPGSLFNHSSAPNVSYVLDPLTESIRYTTTRRILPGEELCIFYGHKLWFDAVDAADGSSGTTDAIVPVDDGFGGLAGLGMDKDGEENAVAGPSNGPTAESILGSCPYYDDLDDDILQDEDLPFTWLKPPPEEEEAGTVRTSERIRRCR